MVMVRKKEIGEKRFKAIVGASLSAFYFVLTLYAVACLFHHGGHAHHGGSGDHHHHDGDLTSICQLLEGATTYAAQQTPVVTAALLLTFFVFTAPSFIPARLNQTNRLTRAPPAST